MSIQQTIERIRTFAAAKGWKKGRLAREANVNKTTLRDFHNETWNPTAETIKKLESVIPDDFTSARAKPAKRKRVVQ